MRKKINATKKLFIICGYSSIYGGNFIPSILAFAEKAKANHKDYYITLVFPDDAADNAWITFIKEKEFNVLFYKKRSLLKSLIKIVKQERPTIIYTHFIQVIVAKIISIFSPKSKLFIHMHSDFGKFKQKTFKNFLKRVVISILKPCAKYICVSESILNNGTTKNAFYVPNALCLNRMTCNHVSGQEFRLSLNIKPEDIVCLVFAWDPYIKGLDVCVDGVFKNYQKNSNIKLLIVCSSVNGEEKAKRFILEKTNCLPNAPFLYYLAPSEDVFKFHEAADIFISSSRSEGYPYSILEALSLNKQIVMSDIPGTQWVKKYEQLVHTFKSEDSQELSEKIKEAIETKKPNYNVFLNNNSFTIDKWTEEIERIIFAI